jgi:hypothetical protein
MFLCNQRSEPMALDSPCMALLYEGKT